ncbi:MAG: glycosyltransferase family 4 protein [Myxococcota bacterium]|nr:glycosyltransferase family 4 protein [Myxococcota bacterium]
MQFHILSFEGPDQYSRAGGLATRVMGLSETLSSLGFETHLWYVGDPGLPGYERQGDLHLHRWCQWVSQHHPEHVYQGELGKRAEYNASLPPFLVERLAPHLEEGGRAVILAEEWQTVDAVLHLEWLLRYRGLRDRVTMLWNANNTFGFDQIPWTELGNAARITTVSRYMKHRMREWGADASVIPNGLGAEAFDAPPRGAVAAARSRLRDRTVLAKMARWDPDKRWLETLGLVAEMKRQNWRPLLLARGGAEEYGSEVLDAARAHGLKVVDRTWSEPGAEGLLDAIQGVGQADVVNLRSHVDPVARRVLFRSSDAVMANSGHEPFGLVGLEAMAAGGVTCTGNSGEDYAQPGQNALVLETGAPAEFMSLYRRLRGNEAEVRRMRRAGQATAKRYAWRNVAESVLLPRVELSQHVG